MTATEPGAGREPLDRALESLPREVPPARDLWSGIESRLGVPPPRRRGHWLRQLAAAVVLVVASSLVTVALVRRDDEGLAARQSVDVDRPAVRPLPAAFGAAHRLSPEYEQARRQLTALLQQRIDRMPPAARSKLEDNLAQLRRAAVEISDSLAEQPGDPLLEELLLGTYQEELAVLAAANQLAAAGGIGPRPDSSRMQL